MAEKANYTAETAGEELRRARDEVYGPPYVAHLADDDNPHVTACGEPWQAWQGPPALPGEVRLPPSAQPREQVDQIRLCQACVHRPPGSSRGRA